MIEITEKNPVDGPLNEELEKIIKEAMVIFENLEYYAKTSLDAENEVEQIRNLINVVKGIELLEERKKLILDTVDKVRDRDIKKLLLDLQRFVRLHTNELNHWMNEAFSKTDKGEKITCLGAVISNLHSLGGLRTMAEELKEIMLI